MVKKTLKNTGSLQIKITLDNSKPPIWRRVLIPNNFTLHDLHLVIQSSFNWFNYHLYGFDIPGKERLQAIDVVGQNWKEWGIEDYQVDSTKLFLKDYLNNDNKYLHYEYDFGDGWRHTIELEEVTVEIIKNPKLIKANNYAPVEDCGAIWGWYEKLDFLKNYPTKPSKDDKEMLEWLSELIPELDVKNPRSFNPKIVDFESIAESVHDYDEIDWET